MCHYESFCIKEGESVDDVFGILQVLLNGLEALGQTFTKAQISLKILDSFSKVCKQKTTTIQEARNLKTLSWDELLGILRVYEVHLQNMDHLQKRNSITLKIGETSSRHEERKSSSKVLKVQMVEFDDSDNSFEGFTNDKVALMSRKFKQIMKKKRKAPTLFQM